MRIYIILVLLVFGLRMSAGASAEPQIVSFQSGDETLNGYLWVPAGKAPFRAVVWNYGKIEPLLKQGSPSQFHALAKFYLENDYVLFIPDRSFGDNPDKPAPKGKSVTEVQESINQDIIAAVSWLRQQSYVDATRVAVAGTLSGATQALLAAERDSTLRAVIIFSPGANTWNQREELRELLIRTVRNSDVPILLIQPQNDRTLKPSETLGQILKERTGKHQVRVYPPFTGPVNMFAMDGPKVWGSDVLSFLDSTMN